MHHLLFVESPAFSGSPIEAVTSNSSELLLLLPPRTLVFFSDFSLNNRDTIPTKPKRNSIPGFFSPRALAPARGCRQDCQRSCRVLHQLLDTSADPPNLVLSAWS